MANLFIYQPEITCSLAAVIHSSSSIHQAMLIWSIKYVYEK